MWWQCCTWVPHRWHQYHSALKGSSRVCDYCHRIEREISTKDGLVWRVDFTPAEYGFQ